MLRRPSGRVAAVARTGIVSVLALVGLTGCPEEGKLTPPSTRDDPPRSASAGSPTAPKSEPTQAPQATIEGDRLAGTAPSRPIVARPQGPSPFRFSEVAEKAGVRYAHISGETPQKQFPTANGSGVAILDYDNDGWMDLYFVSNCHLPEASPPDGMNRLFRNKGDGSFEDVTESAGVGFRGFCHGAIAADFDNDGDTDIFLCNYGPGVLYENLGDGTFVNIAKKAGVDGFHWSSSGAFLDYDNDGDLDLYIANYGVWDPEEDDKFCGDRNRNIRMYCSPRTIRTVKHILYRNNGDKTFTNVTDEAGLTRDDGHGFGVVAADLNGDGKIDLWVANDLNPKFLYLNNGDGTFRDATDLSGAALDVNGNAQAGMGADAEDVDGDGLPELFATHFQNEYNTLYQNLGNGGFFDQTAAFGLAADSIPHVGWGCGLVDLNNDGWPDCFVANGHVDDNRHLIYPGTAPDFEQPALLYLNEGVGAPPNQGRRFRLATRDVGPYFEAKHVSRGCAFGDLDNDGRLDIVISQRGGLAAILHNDTPHENNRWIRLKMVGTRSNREAIGARIEAQVGKRTIYRQKKGGCSMMSTNDPRILIGLGDAAEVTKLTVRWPSGQVTVLEGLACDRMHEVVEPKGEEARP